MATIGIGLLEWTRRRQELSATELAARMGVSRSSVSQIERGFQTASTAFKEKAAEALGVSVEELWPELYVLVRAGTGTTELHTTDALVSAFTTADRASASAGQGERVAGPLPPSFFAALLDVSEAEVPAEVAIDPKPKTRRTNGATRSKDRAAKRTSVEGARRDTA